MPGVIGVGPTPFFAAQLCGVSAKLNHSNSMPAIDREAQLLGARQHALQRLARADRRGRAVGVDELAEEERHVAVPRHVAVGVEVEPRQRVGKAVLPAGERGVVVGAGRPMSQPNTTSQKPKPPLGRLGGAEELVDVQVLAAQDAVDVADRDLDLAGAALANRGERGMFGVGVAIVVVRSVRSRIRQRRCGRAARDAHLLQRRRRRRATACFISSRPIAPMQPTRKVSTCVSLPG